VIKTGEEAGLFVSEVRKLVRYLDVCDGNMEEGSLRCDANISVMLKGASEFGTKVEVKNMNSISNVRKAIEFETERQIESIEKNIAVLQETRSFDAVKGVTFSMRAKEVATDYRYFPEPDLPPLIITKEWIEETRANMPRLPEELYLEFTQNYGLSHYDASVITESKEVASYYINMLAHTKNYKAAANYLMGAVKGYLNKNAMELSNFALKPLQIAEIIRLVDEGVISNAVGEQTLFPALVENPEKTAVQLAKELNVIQNSDGDFIDGLITESLAAYPDKVEAYKQGKKGLLGLFMGEVMKRSGGKADPKLATHKLKEALGD
ncbi:MAG: aspartyl-tRNA(Asn)/glutamyl-tRNA(Gln) amidotransferase subunit B, partial [bacterium]